MKILALEFSSRQRSVAVLNPEKGLPVELVDTQGGRQMKPFAMIDSTLRQAGLDRQQIEMIAIGLGPGSYTGIRAAIALAQGWRLARGVGLRGISSTECLATQMIGENITGTFNVVVDAQRGEFYLASYRIAASRLDAISPLRIVSAEAIRERASAGEAIIGPEAKRWFPEGREAFPRGQTLARMASAGGRDVPDELEPIYLRQTDFVKASASIPPV